MIDGHEAEYWARQIRVGALIAAAVTLLGAVRVGLDWGAAQQRWVLPILAAGLLQAVSAVLPWNGWVQRPLTRRLLVGWWVAELPVLYLFARGDTDGLMLYLPGATLILVLAAALFEPLVVVGLGVLSVSGFLALLPYETHVGTIAVLGMVSIMAGVVGVNAIIAHNRAKLDARRRSAERRTEALLENSSDLVIALGDEGHIRYASPSVGSALGRNSAELTGDMLSSLVHPDDLPRIVAWMRQVWAGTAGHTARNDLRLRQADGTYMFLDAVATNRLHDPDLHAVVVSLRDIGIRRALEEQLSRQAFTDSLTDLANRAQFGHRLTHAVAQDDDRGLAVLLIDLDDFKTVNDELGHSAGDELLTVVADRLRNRIRPGDTLARLGGDEFAILLDGADIEDAAALAERLLDEIRRPVRLASRDIQHGASIGIAVSGDRRQVPAEQLLRNADLAMYAAKRLGRNRCEVFDTAMYDSVRREAQQRADMELALIQEQFELHYQPVVDLPTGDLLGFEALVRWQHPREGLLGPGHFIDHAENSGLIVPLGRWVLREACRQLAGWQRTLPAGGDLTMNVNLSARQFQQADLVAEVSAAIADAGIDASSLTLEITESMLMDNIDIAAQTLHALRRLGVSLAIDDFGTGYSSLSYLQRLPVNIIKIDRSFVEHVDTNPDNLALVDAVITLGHALGLQTVAEGIETTTQRDTLQRLGCQHGQGFLFSRPSDAATITERLSARQETATPAA